WHQKQKKHSRTVQPLTQQQQRMWQRQGAAVAHCQKTHRHSLPKNAWQCHGQKTDKKPLYSRIDCRSTNRARADRGCSKLTEQPKRAIHDLIISWCEPGNALELQCMTATV